VEPRPHAHETFRSFIAVPLDEPVRRFAEERIRALRERIGGDSVRWVRPENLHVTLRFLGNIERRAVPNLVAAVREETAESASFSARIGGLRTFPPSKRPRVVVLDVGPETALAGLAAAVERAVRRAGFDAEERPFRPHLTLGRVARRSRRAPAANFPDTADLEASEGMSFEVTESVLFQSELLSSGARYTALERFPLRAGAGT
jgi:2'-5' RNA ligase